MPTLQTSALKKKIDEYEDDCTPCSVFYIQLVDRNIFYKDVWGGAGAVGAEIFAPLFLIKSNFRNHDTTFD